MLELIVLKSEYKNQEKLFHLLQLCVHHERIWVLVVQIFNQEDVRFFDFHVDGNFACRKVNLKTY